jgi:hypothetical protein
MSYKDIKARREAIKNLLTKLRPKPAGGSAPASPEQ